MSMMIESLENTLQIAVLLLCAALALLQAVRGRSRAWMLAFFFFGSFLLGDIYWLAVLLFFDQTPQISVVSDLSWYASYLFLYLLLRQLDPPEERGKAGLLAWAGPAFAAGMAVFFMLRGEILSNLIYASLMGLLLFASLRRLADRGETAGSEFLPLLVLIFCMLEYALWTASCFWAGDTLQNPYYWFDFLLTLSFPCFIPAVRRAVAA